MSEKRHEVPGTKPPAIITLWICVGIAGAHPASAREIHLRSQGQPDALYSSVHVDDTMIVGGMPHEIFPPNAVSLNTSDFFPEPRGILLRFDLGDPILDEYADRIESAGITLYTNQSSATADQDMPVWAAALTPANAAWFSSATNWLYRDADSMIAWAGGTGGPLTPGVDYMGAVDERLVLVDEMNSTGTPIRFALDPDQIRTWIADTAANGGVFCWSTLIDNGGAGLDDNFHVYSSEGPVPDLRPTLHLRMMSPFTPQVFDREDLLIDGGNGWADTTNIGGTYTWGTAAVNVGYLTLYRVTGDECYLQKFIDQYDQVLAHRDDMSSHVPEDAPAWSEGPRFPNYISAPISSGAILIPMVRFARMVGENPLLSSRPFYVNKAAEYSARAKETIDWLNDHFLIVSGINARSYAPYIDGTGGMDAVHVDATMMRVQYDYYKATGDAFYLDIADKLARTIRDTGLYVNSAGVQTWQYAYDGPPDPDDCSHAAYAGPHIAHMIRDYGILTESQGAGLARALVESAFQKGGTVTPGIDGTPYLERSNSVSSGHWSWGYAGGLIELAQFDMRLIPITEIVQLRNWGTSTDWYEFGDGKLGWPLMGIARLVRYSVVPQEVRLEMIAGNYRTTASAHLGLLETNRVTLISDLDAGQTQTLDVDVAGRGDEWERWWELTLQFDASTAPALHGQPYTITITLLDGYGNTKSLNQVAGAPTGLNSQINPQGDELSLQGTLDAALTIIIEAGEETVVRNPGWMPWIAGDCCVPIIQADQDCDDDVDLDDFAIMQVCMSGPFNPISTAVRNCHRSDLNADQHVDGADLAVLQQCVSGSGIPLDPACMD